MNECKKLKTTKSEIKLADCLKFNELMLLKCPMKKALSFARKDHCRYDITKTRDGPHDFKRLKVRKTMSTGVIVNGWMKGNPEMSNKYQVGNLKNKGKFNLIMKTYIDNQSKDIKERAVTLERRIDSISNFYSNLNTKYSFKQLDKKQLYNKLKTMNAQRTREGSENISFKANVSQKANEIYTNIGKYKRNYLNKMKYQKAMKMLAKRDYELNFSNKHDKKMIDILKKDLLVIQQLNDSHYKFPLFNKTIQQNEFKIKNKSKSNNFFKTFNKVKKWKKG